MLPGSIQIGIFLLFSMPVFSQNPNLCGVWIGKSYQCYTQGPGGSINLYYKDEVVLVSQNGTLITATKYTGDECVLAGQITWEGNYNSNPFSVGVHTGSPSAPNSVQVSGNVTVNDSSHFVLIPGAIKFTKLSCRQLDSLQIDADQLAINCVDCPKTKKDQQELIPTVFTPNKDGINDHFLPKVKEQLVSSELEIYNRWGNMVFKTTELYKSWDGLSAGAACADGMYFWIYTYTDDAKKEHILKGFVSLFR